MGSAVISAMLAPTGLEPIDFFTKTGGGVTKLFSILLAVVMLFTTFDAEAKRMGGGKSMGRQSSNVTQREAARTPAAPGNQAATAGAAGAAGAGAAAAARPPGR